MDSQKLIKCGNAEGGEYETADGRFYVRLELAGLNHGSVTLEDRVGSGFRGSFGEPLSTICRCGGLESARKLIADAYNR
jgi:hypothetical protein